MLKELDSRDSDGIIVSLFFETNSKNSPTISPLLVTVSDTRTEETISIPCETVKAAREAFAHPYAVADSILNPSRVAA